MGLARAGDTYWWPGSLSECATNIGIIATISPVIVTQMSTRPNNGPAISDANCPTFVLINKHFEPVLLECYEYIFESIAISRNIYILYTRIRGQQKQAAFSRACGWQGLPPPAPPSLANNTKIYDTVQMAPEIMCIDGRHLMICGGSWQTMNVIPC